MEILLNDVEVRVLGCLIEKELATPEYYPLTLNSLTTACNQKSNRDPVMALEESEVVRALDGLKMKHVAIQAADSGRVPRYRHILAERLRFSPAELAILAELLLRGPQTLGELRTRAERMHPFTDLTAVEQVLGELAERTPPRVMRLPRQPGRKESRFAHLLAGEPDLSAEERPAPPEGARLQVMAENERLAALESEVAALKAEVAELRQVMEEFRSQFE
ncbi:YceH family protein [Geobacter anodireducens]|uniref:Uncharacterized protein n=1 Tax=Geobacter soli TaxID=1510391 RepID=A0A0C1QSL5_9BACT|nr:YceH family protein [Geobacter soli]KIE43902.1 hypothetical protein SE37_15355 [Geobacter soli]